MLILVLLTCLIGASPVQAQSSTYAWTAYNDCTHISGQTDTNISTYQCYTNNANGLLRNYATGSNTTVSVRVTVSNVSSQTTADQRGAESNAGTDAYNTFHGIADMVGGVRLNQSGSYVNLAFTGLDPTKTYTFATTANRADSDYTSRVTRFVLQDATTAVNASTIGATRSTTNFSEDTTAFITGYNTVNGYVARWTGIQPGSDGDFNVNFVRNVTGTEAYGPAVFMLAEEDSTTPRITTSGSLSAFSSQPGTASTAQTYTVSGFNLTEDISVSAPAGFEVSSDGITYSASMTLPQSGGTVYARLISAGEGDFSGNITHASTGAVTANMAVNGTVLYIYTLTSNTSGAGSIALNPAGGSYNNGTQVTLTATAGTGYAFSSWSGDLTGSANPATITMDANKNVTANFIVTQCSTVNLPAVEDTWLRASQNTTNFGGDTSLSLNANGDYSHVALLKWNLGSIPAEATIESASITVNVSDASTIQFSLYNMRQAWVEGTGTTEETPSNNSANWNTYNGVNNWGTAGARSTTTDRFNTNLWDTTAINASGAQTRSLNSSGVAVLQDWLSAPASNNGLTIQTTGSTNNYLVFASSEAATAAQRPQLNVSYCLPNPSPVITTSGTLSAFSTPQGTTSAAQTYTVAGSGLTGNISISAPAGFELSTDNITYVPGLELVHTAGNVNTTTIYVRLNGAAFGSFSGDIAHTSAGAATMNVAASGTVTNTAPAAPVLVQPADDAAGVETSPALQVTVSDPNPADTLDISFYGREAGELDFVLIGTVADAANGGSPSITWSGLETGTQFEWYAVASDGSLETDSPTWSFTTIIPNLPPVIAEGETTTVIMSEDGSSVPFSLTLHAADPNEADTLTWGIATDAQDGTASASGTGPSRIVNYQPDLNYNGSDSFVVQVDDGSGGIDTITVNVTVEPVNDAPEITGQAVLSTPEETALTITLADLTVTDVDNTYPTGFSLTLQSGLNYTFTGAALTPADNFNGSLTVPVIVNDGTDSSAVYNLTVTVTAVNDVPVAVNDEYSIDENTTLNVTAAFGVLSNDSDVDNNPLTAVQITDPAHGTLTANEDGSFSYVPDGDWTGSDSFTYRASDGTATSAPALVTIEVVSGQVPVLPSSFYGEIHILDNPPADGEVLEVYKAGEPGIAASTVITTFESDLVYSIDVPGGIHGAASEGTILTFMIDGRVVATSVWHSGTNVSLDIHPPQALPGGPYTGEAGAAISFDGSAEDWGDDANTYQWDWENDGIYDATGQTPSHTWTAVGTYTVGLTVIDDQGGEGLATVTVTVSEPTLVHSIPLVVGWNLVSFNLHPLDTDLTEVLTSISGNYDLVYAWDATGASAASGNWTKFDVVGPEFQNTLLSLDETMGFWVHMTAADTLQVTGTEPEETSIALTTSAGGWNLVGYPSQADRALPTALSANGVETDFTLVHAYHASDSSDSWKLFDRTGPPYVNDLSTMTPGWGYWIFVTTDADWDVDFSLPH